MENGRMKAGIADIGLGAVDVRDLAEAHLRAAYLPEAKGRHIISGHNTSLPEIARVLLPASMPIQCHAARCLSGWSG
ncbi:MAG: hypothetical protein ACSLEN_01825 [Candidatus Malihini olakiniferum]